MRDADEDAVVIGGVGGQPTPTPPPSGRAGVPSAGERTIELREEQLVPRKELRTAGEILVHTQAEEVTGRLRVPEYREEASVERIPVHQEVQERRAPWEEDGAIVVPIYEEQLVAVKQLVLREYLRIRRVGITRQRLFEDNLRRERLFVEDPTGLVHEAGRNRRTREGGRATEEASESDQGNPLERLVRKVFESS